MPQELTLKDFEVGEVVYHVFFCRYATIQKIGKKYLTVKIHLGNQKVTWLPTSVIKTANWGGSV